MSGGKVKSQHFRISQLWLDLCCAYIPVTSRPTPSERIFSTAIVTLNAKRSAIAVSTVDKVIFKHGNQFVLYIYMNMHTLMSVKTDSKFNFCCGINSF
jgi:hypothetical protein